MTQRTIQEPGSGKAVLAASALAAVITFLIYLPSLQNGFVNWDDPKYVYENPLIRTLDLDFIRWAFTSVYFSNWHPLTMISYAVDYSIWGLNPLGYHLVNIIFHALNTFLAGVLAVKIIEPARKLSAFSAFAAALVTALLFGIHPLHVESVAWISERKDVLSGFFFILSLIFYLRYAKAGRLSCYILSLVSFLFALMSKPMAISLPAVLLIIDFFPLKRLSTLREASIAFLEKTPFFIAALFSVFMTLFAQRSTVASLESIPFDMRLFGAAKAYAFYIVKVFVPVNLAPFYPYPLVIDLTGFEYLGSLIFLAGMTLLSIILIRRFRGLLSAWLYYLITLAPVIGIVQVGIQAAADRYMYLPSLSIFILLGWCAGVLIEKNIKALNAAIAMLVAVSTILLTYLTVNQVSIWKDSLSLWDYEIKMYPESDTVGYTNRGVVLSRMGDLDKALRDFNKAIEINPNYRDARYNRALALKTLGRYEESLIDLNRAIQVRPSGEAHNNRGNVLKKLGNNLAALEDYRKAVELSPANGAFHFNLALALEEAGDIQGASRSAEEALLLGFKDAQGYLEHLRQYPAPM